MAVELAHLDQRNSTEIRAAGGMNDVMMEVLNDMESLGILTTLGGKIVGGVALTHSYYKHMMLTEGRGDDIPPCQLLVTMPQDGGSSVALLPVQQAQMEAGRPELPREGPVLSKIMSPAALDDLHWSRVPAVVIFGGFVADADELQEAAAAGLPISPSMTGPHPEELQTQMEVFFRAHSYPSSKCFILRDWGFLIAGSDLGDATATFNEQLKGALVGSSESGAAATAIARCSGDIEASGDGGLSSGADGGGDGTAGTPRSLPGALAQAFRRLHARVMLRSTQSMPQTGDVDVLVQSSEGIAHGGPLTATSEPSSPMLGGGAAELRLLSMAAHRKSSEAHRVPSFQTGFKPW